MDKWYRRIMALLLGITFILGMTMMVRQLLQYRLAAQANAQAQQLVQANTDQTVQTPETLPPDTEATDPPQLPQVSQTVQAEPLDEAVSFLFDTDLTQLQQVNKDVIGWIHIPESDISFPLMRSYDNEDYLYHAWDGSYSSSGSIFLECKNRKNMLDFNTIIYGHHMRNGTVFASLMEYRHQQYRDSHPYIYILTDNDLRRYQVFSAYEAPIDSDTYRLYYPDEAVKSAALEHFVNSSVLEKERIPTTSDYILTLSTCTGTGIYDTRWVVQSVLDGIWPR